MFFSTELLSQSTSPFAKIWSLGACLEPIQNADNKLKIKELAEAIQEWIDRLDIRRLSLPLSGKNHF